jgi:L-lactate dehydrogenase complex protein LldG
MSTGREGNNDGGGTPHPEPRADDPDVILRDGRRLDHAEGASKPLRSASDPRPEPQPRGARVHGDRPIDQAEAAARFIAAPEHEKMPASLLDAFKVNLHRMGGIFLDPMAAGDIRAKIASAKVVCSVVPEIPGNRDIVGIGAPRDLADVDFAIVRASFAVAETGSVLLNETDLRVNAVAYLAQHLIVLLDPTDIVLNLHHAYRRPEFRDGHYACFHTGPSATADIEGVLIHGAQGVRSLSILPMARSAGDQTH